MTTVAVYPKLGTMYPDANGDTITSAGAIVSVSKYITDALNRGYLLNWDPLDVFEPDDRSSATVPGTGYQPDYVVVTEAPYRASGDGIADDTEAIQAALDAATSSQTTVYLPAGTYRITASLLCGPDSNGKNAIKILGQASTGGGYEPATVILWDGAGSADGGGSYVPALWLGGYDMHVEDLCFKVKSGKSLYAAINCSYYDAPGQFNSHFVFRGITITGEDQTDRNIYYGITVGGTANIDRYSGGNFENCVFTDMFFRNCRHSGVHFYGGQPYNSTFDRAHFVGGPVIGPGSAKQGIGVSVANTGSASGRFANCDFQSLECWANINGGWTFAGGESENCHSAVRIGGLTLRNAQSVSVSDMRVALTDALGRASLGPLSLASGAQFFYSTSGTPFVLKNCSFTGSGNTEPMYIEVGSSAGISSESCTYPNIPFRIYEDYGVGLGEVVQGGIRSRLDAYGPTNDQIPIPTYDGGINPTSTTTISGAATTSVIVLPTTEIDTSYKVSLDIESVTGTPTIGIPYISAKSATGFTISLSAAPGLGNTVTIRYTTWR